MIDTVVTTTTTAAAAAAAAAAALAPPVPVAGARPPARRARGERRQEQLRGLLCHSPPDERCSPGPQALKPPPRHGVGTTCCVARHAIRCGTGRWAARRSSTSTSCASSPPPTMTTISCRGQSECPERMRMEGFLSSVHTPLQCVCSSCAQLCLCRLCRARGHSQPCTSTSSQRESGRIGKRRTLRCVAKSCERRRSWSYVHTCAATSASGPCRRTPTCARARTAHMCSRATRASRAWYAAGRATSTRARAPNRGQPHLRRRGSHSALAHRLANNTCAPPGH